MESHVDHVFNEELMNLGSMFFFDQDFNHFTGHGLFSTEHHQGLNDLGITPILSANESISSTSCNIVDDQILAYSTSDHDIGSNFCNNFSQDHVFDQYNDLCMMGGDNSNFLFLAQIFSDDVMDEFQCLKQDEVVEKGKMGNSVCQPLPVADLSKETHLKRKYEMLEIPTLVEEGNTGKINKTKTTFVSNNKKNKRNLPPKKVQKMMVSSTNRSEDNGEETRNINRTGNVHSPSSCNSEDDSNTTQDVNQRDMVTEKTRAGRGAATDPQSIYARKRRERINERLRILQTLVPNGTKVDISTMLEEAVHYVKFLQLQINLLSSDDKWMYAPIAYNGVDMGLYQNIITPSL